MTRTYKLHLWHDALTPISQAKGVEGNESLINRQAVETPAGVRNVPVISGNALRHCAVRGPGSRFLIDALGLAGRLSLMQLNFLQHGGNLTESNAREDTRRIAEMQELFPLLRLLGGSLPDQILAGSLRADFGHLACDENLGRMAAALPPGFAAALPPGALKPAEHYVSGTQYTRGDAGRDASLYDPATRDAGAKSNLMIMGGECVIPGAAFWSVYVLARATEVEYGCLLHAIGLWQEQGGTVGGMASKGHGRLATSLLGGDAGEIAAAVATYLAHVAASKDACVGWLARAFAKKADKPAKAAKGKKAAAAVLSDGEADDVG